VPVRILLVDDDRELCGMLTEYLAQEGFSVSSVHDGAEAQAALAADAYALVILDVMLPGSSGLDLLKHLRLRHDVPVLMLTARGEDVDRVVGLELGADDYLAKPCNVRELVARLRAILRRVERTHARGTDVTLAQLALDRRMQTISCRNAPLALTGAEYRILEILMEQAGEVVSRERLLNDALGRRLLPWDRSIDTHVSNLRRKLSAVGAGVRIVGVRGSGYQLLG
jgi:two-component system response regulator CpxR